MLKMYLIKNQLRRLLLFLTAFLLCLASVYGNSEDRIEELLNRTGDYILSTVKEPKVGSIGGEWAILGLARSGHAVPDSYWQSYRKTLEGVLKRSNGNLHERKYTEYSRVILALTAIGVNPQNISGYNLLLPLADYKKTIQQGINGPIWALLALDSGNYKIPVNPNAEIQANRQMYIDKILSLQLPDGGWSLSGERMTGQKAISDPDITAMALQALAKYQDQPAVKDAVDRALIVLSDMQRVDGGYSADGRTTNLESTAQVLVAILELGLEPDDSRFVKKGNTLLQHILTFYQKDGSFLHVHAGDGSNQMATEQGYYTLAAVWRARQGKNSLYRMSDVASPLQTEWKLGKTHPDVRFLPIINDKISFSDMKSHRDRDAVHALAARNIISGTGDGKFSPDKEMTRAEFATVVVRALGLLPKKNATFDDVPANAWYADYVGAAYHYKLVYGIDAVTFRPTDLITREQAATLVMRAAHLCGLNRPMTIAEVRKIITRFGDHTDVSPRAQEGLAFCYANQILDSDEPNMEPSRYVLRAEIARMLYNLLRVAELIRKP
ncbi:MAG: S-layer homology domain-containing protein [Bacillota bacterium]|nr:S-layer homology domain-containing protein [Bacillota bacterium]